MRPTVLFIFSALTLLLASTAQAQVRQGPAQSNGPCIPGDPVRSDCRSSPTYNQVPGPSDAIRQAPGYGQQQQQRPQRQGEGVPQR